MILAWACPFNRMVDLWYKVGMDFLTSESDAEPTINQHRLNVLACCEGMEFHLQISPH